MLRCLDAPMIIQFHPDFQTSIHKNDFILRSTDSGYNPGFVLRIYSLSLKISINNCSPIKVNIYTFLFIQVMSILPELVRFVDARKWTAMKQAHSMHIVFVHVTWLPIRKCDISHQHICPILLFSRLRCMVSIMCYAMSLIYSICYAFNIQYPYYKVTVYNGYSLFMNKFHRFCDNRCLGNLLNRQVVK